MKTLILMRHAKSDQKDKKVKEHKRPLTKKGEQSAERVGEWAREHALMPDLILSSPSVRACKTAEIVKDELGYQGEIKLDDDLYMAEMDELISVIKKLPDDASTVIVVGHNPGLESLIPLFTREVAALPTAGMARLSLPVDHWSDLKRKTKGDLVDIITPKQLKKANPEAGDQDENDDGSTEH